MTTPWIPCPGCDEFYCTIHQMHACDCDCPPVDEWETDPYSEREEAVKTLDLAVP